MLDDLIRDGRSHRDGEKKNPPPRPPTRHPRADRLARFGGVSALFSAFSSSPDAEPSPSRAFAYYSAHEHSSRILPRSASFPARLRPLPLPRLRLRERGRPRSPSRFRRLRLASPLALLQLRQALLGTCTLYEISSSSASSVLTRIVVRWEGAGSASTSPPRFSIRSITSAKDLTAGAGFPGREGAGGADGGGASPAAAA